MRFYNVDLRGRFLLERRASAPAVQAARMYYNTNDENIYVGDSTANQVVWTNGNVDDLVTCINLCCGTDAATLNGQAGSYYQCADNINAGTLPTGRLTGTYNISISGNAATATNATNATNATCASDADTLDGQHCAYYRCANLATGTLPLNHGGTGSTTASGARNNLGLIGTSNTTHYHDGRYYTESEADGRYGRCTSGNTWTSTNCFTSYLCGTGGIRLIHSGSLTYASLICACSYGALCVSSSSGSGVAIYTRAMNNRALYGSNNSATYGAVHGNNSGSYAAVSGNTGYCNVSSKYLKHLDDICISKCLRCTPLQVYKYYWEDINQIGFNETIGPTAEDLHDTFNMHHTMDADEYKGVYSMDGIALGLGIENLNEIDTMKKIIVKLYDEVKELKAQIGG